MIEVFDDEIIDELPIIFYTVKPEDVGNHYFRFIENGKRETAFVSEVVGYFQIIDIGKRMFRGLSGLWKIESTDQFLKRTK